MFYRINVTRNNCILQNLDHVSTNSRDLIFYWCAFSQACFLFQIVVWCYIVLNWTARLVLALGAEAKLDLVPGAAEYALPFSTLDDALVSFTQHCRHTTFSRLPSIFFRTWLVWNEYWFVACQFSLELLVKICAIILIGIWKRDVQTSRDRRSGIQENGDWVLAGTLAPVHAGHSRAPTLPCSLKQNRPPFPALIAPFRCMSFTWLPPPPT